MHKFTMICLVLNGRSKTTRQKTPRQITLPEYVIAWNVIDSRLLLVLFLLSAFYRTVWPYSCCLQNESHDQWWLYSECWWEKTQRKETIRGESMQWGRCNWRTSSWIRKSLAISCMHSTILCACWFRFALNCNNRFSQCNERKLCTLKIKKNHPIEGKRMGMWAKVKWANRHFTVIILYKSAVEAKAIARDRNRICASPIPIKTKEKSHLLWTKWKYQPKQKETTYFTHRYYIKRGVRYESVN